MFMINYDTLKSFICVITQLYNEKYIGSTGACRISNEKALKDCKDCAPLNCSLQFCSLTVLKI